MLVGDVPVRPGPHFDLQRHVEPGGGRHQLVEQRPHVGERVGAHFQHELVVHLHDQLGR